MSASLRYRERENESVCCVRGRLQKGLLYGVDGEERRPEFKALREET
jgi:hypothetical protein